MIQAKDLRIGNYIEKSLKSGQGRKLIGKIGCQDIVRISENTGSFNYEPIPLTEEILLKCGFELREVTIDGKTQKHYSDFKSIAIELLSKDFFMLGLHKGYEEVSSLKRVEYIHQLQNLYFALTNTELEINL